MTPPSAPGPKRLASRLVRWSLGTVVAAVVLGSLGVAGVILWAVNVSLPAHQRDVAEAEAELARRAASQAQHMLAEAATDGRLTDDEIRAAVEKVWDVQRTGRTWVVRARFEGTDPLCFSYRVTVTPGREPSVVGAELPACPEFTRAP